MTPTVCYIVASLCTVASAGAPQVPPPAGALHEFEEIGSAPHWIALPAHGQLEVAFGMRFEIVHSVVVSRDNPRAAVLSGAVRNLGRERVSARLALQYFGPEGEKLQPAADNTAAVFWVAGGDLLPFRFPLISRDQLSGRPVLYRINVDAAPPGMPPPLDSARVRLRGARSLRRGQGVAVTGFIEMDADTAPPSPRSLVVTLLLMDARGRVLDVVAERPFLSVHSLTAGEPLPFEIRSVMPVSKTVRDIKAWLTMTNDE